MDAPMGGRHQGPAPNTAGPHRHDLLNKLDPTVDSQHGGVQILGPGVNATAPGSTGTAQQPPLAGSGGNPRVDGRTGNAGSTAPAAAPGIAAPLSSHTRQQMNAQNSGRGANVLDPYTESGVDGRQPVGRQNPANTLPVQAGGVVQPGPAPQTAGPHRHDIMNKLDPTVNSKATVQQQPQYRTG